MTTKLTFTMDVEDWHHSENVKTFIPEIRDGHSSLQCVAKVMDVLQAKKVRGTFFFLGSVGKKNSALVRELHHEGHEIANHGWDHTLLNDMSETQTQYDIEKSTDVLASIVGEQVVGYRSPCFSVNNFIFDLLAAKGYRYTSIGISAFLHDRYRDNRGHPTQLVDFELPTAAMWSNTVPATGGGWFRLFPIWLQKALLAQSKQSPKIFYCHPWDFDIAKPEIDGLPALYKFRHKVNTSTALQKLASLDFEDTRLIDHWASLKLASEQNINLLSGEVHQ